MQSSLISVYAQLSQSIQHILALPCRSSKARVTNTVPSTTDIFKLCLFYAPWHLYVSRRLTPYLLTRHTVQGYQQQADLDKENRYRCKCGQEVQATKKLQLVTTPEVLVLQLVRFSHSEAGREKLETAVDFPMQGLDLGDFVQRRSNQVCILMSINVHWPYFHDCLLISVITAGTNQQPVLVSAFSA